MKPLLQKTRNKILEKIDNYSKQLNFEMALELKQELEYIDYITEKHKYGIS